LIAQAVPLLDEKVNSDELQLSVTRTDVIRRWLKEAAARGKRGK
jgi:hypothetical protein